MMVSASFHPYIGGAEKQALELSVALRARGHRVQVATRRLAGLAAFEEIRGVPVQRLWRAGSGLVDASTFLLSLSYFLWHRAVDYDVIHVHLAGSPALAACLMGRLLRKRVFVKLGGGAGIGELAASARTPAGRLKLRALALLKPQFIAVATDLAAEAARYLGEGIEVHVLPNGVDAERYKPADGPAARGELRKRLCWPEKGFIFLYMGRLSPEKRLAPFVESWARAIQGARGTCALALIGEGAEESAIRDAIQRMRAGASVHIDPPMRDPEVAYAAADVFVLPSVSEGLSNALLEAMASGLAVLASRVGGTPEVVRDGVSGLLFDADDQAGLARQLGTLLARPEAARSMGLAARQTVLEHFSIGRTAERCEALYVRVS